MKVSFGEPINASDLDRSKSDLEWAQVIKDKVYQLAR